MIAVTLGQRGEGESLVGYDEAALRKRAEDYIHKAQVLRQIQSVKLEKSEFRDNALNYSTVITSAAVTVLGFFGVKNLHTLFFSKYITIEVLDFTFNVFVFLLLIAAFLQITLNLKEKSLGHLHSIRELTAFLTTLDDVKLLKGLSDDACAIWIERLNNRYLSINSSLPTNSDKEWRKAKKMLEAKG